MFSLRAISICSCAMLSLLVSFRACAVQSRIEDRVNKPDTAKKKAPNATKRTVWNLDGGVFFATDGHLENGSCFRLSGQLTAPAFFDGLRRVDTDAGTTYLLRDKTVTEFPGELFITLHLLDSPCSQDLKDTAVRPPLTPEIMGTLSLRFYWKDGIAMRPVEFSMRTSAHVTPIPPFSAQAAAELAPRYQWNYTFVVYSSGVPLTDDLVLIIENPDHKIAARTAARL